MRPLTTAHLRLVSVSAVGACALVACLLPSATLVDSLGAGGNVSAGGTSSSGGAGASNLAGQANQAGKGGGLGVGGVLDPGSGGSGSGGGPDAGLPVPEELCAGPSPAGAVAVNAAYVYWTTRQGSLHRVVKDGGTIEILGSGLALATASALALDSGHVYCGGMSALYECDLGGCGMPAPTLILGQPGYIASLALDDTRVFFTDRSSGQVAYIPKIGGAIQDITTETSPDTVTPAAGIAVAGPIVYWGAGDGDITFALRWFDLDTAGPVETIASNLPGEPSGVVADGDDMFALGGGQLYRYQVAAKALDAVDTVESSEWGSLHLDADAAYYAGAEGITRLDRATGTTSTVCATGGVTGIATDSSYVYFANRQGKVMRCELP